MTMRSSRTFGLVLVLAGVLVAIAPALAADGQPRFRRGIGIGHVMAWAAIAPGAARQFVYPPFAEVSAARFAAELQALRRAGFDFVRLAVDPGPFLQFQGARRDALDRMLVARVNVVLAAGLDVIVDFHPSDMHPAYTAAALTQGLTSPLFGAYLKLIERTAALLDGLRSAKVALELMNEPPASPEAWQPMLDAAYAAARRGSARLALVVEGGNEGSAAALMAMRTAAFAQDRAVWFSFHYYDPYQFTHQGASWNAARYLADVPYPARARPLDDSVTATAASIRNSGLSAPRQAQAYRDAQERLEQYRDSGFDGAAVAGEFERVANWARSQGIAADRIMLGEFGARQTALQRSGARANERAQWFRDVRHAAEAHNFGWAVWVYRGPGFGLAPEPGTAIEPDLAEALGLNSSAPRKAALSARAH
jgi:endoglucanase